MDLSSVFMKVKGVSIVASNYSEVQVSTLSSSVYGRFVRKPGRGKDVNMKMVDGNVLSGFIVHPVTMKVTSQTFKERLYVAPINDAILLGHDRLRHFGVWLHLKYDALVMHCIYQ